MPPKKQTKKEKNQDSVIALRQQLANEKELRGVAIADSLIHNTTGKNKLKPNVNLEEFSGPQFNTLAEWVSSHAVALLISLFRYFLCGGAEGKAAWDQQERAVKLAESLQPHHSAVVLMDGHGRIVLLFCWHVLQLYGPERLNSLTIYLVDIDPVLVKYHAEFFSGPACENIWSIKRDITTIPPAGDLLIYANFCGISASANAMGDCLKRYYVEAGYMISWATRNTSVDNGEDDDNDKVAISQERLATARILDQALKPQGLCLQRMENDRKSFVTFVVVPIDGYKPKISDLNKLIKPSYLRWWTFTEHKLRDVVRDLLQRKLTEELAKIYMHVTSRTVAKWLSDPNSKSRKSVLAVEKYLDGSP